VPEPLSFERGIIKLRGRDAHRAWNDRLTWRPMIPGTFIRAPIGDMRHAAALPSALRQF
jgi:hypothetical protein